MKFKLLLSLLAAGTLSVAAQQGYKDGVEYYRADKVDDAKIILDRTINDASTDKAEANYYLGMIALSQGDNAAAKSYFEKGISANAENPFNYVGLGSLLLKSGDAKGAQEQFKQARNFGKKNAVLLTDIARAYYDADPVAYKKELDKAITDAKKADKTCAAIYILEGDMLAPNSIGDAVGYYEMAWNYDTQNQFPEAYVKYAQVYFSVNPQFAIQRLQELVQKNPNSALAQRELAEKYYDNNQLTLAAREYGKYIQNPNHFQKDEQRYVGLMYFAKEYEPSLKLANEILSKDPGNHYMERMAFLNKAALENWADAATAAQTFFSNSNAKEFTATDYTTYGDVLFHTGDTIAALDNYKKAVDMHPDKADNVKSLSEAYASAKMYDKSAETFEKYLGMIEPTTNDKFTLGRRYSNAAAMASDSIAKVQLADKALLYLDEVLKAVPDNFTVANQKAITLYNRNNQAMSQEVVDAFLAALAILDKDREANKTSHKNDYVRAYNLIANYYLAEGDKETAKQYLNLFLEVDPDNQPLRDYVEKMK
ncbi:MAG: hypothetical protein OSJ34_02840 [Muribaculaceae bacterium]|jgi:Uncharacterized membrane-bound protein|nr:hypothetical protein [Muribaculaceae bacterium]